MLSFDLPNSTHLKMLPALAASNNQQVDSGFWNSINSAYKILRLKNITNMHVLTTQEDSSWLWKVRTVHKIKTFLRLAYRNKLPSIIFLYRRKIISSPSCPQCPHGLEDTENILRQCVAAKTCHLLRPKHSSYSSLSKTFQTMVKRKFKMSWTNSHWYTLAYYFLLCLLDYLDQ